MYVRLYDVDIPKEKWLNYRICKPCSAASDLGLHCLPVPFRGLQWPVKGSPTYLIFTVQATQGNQLVSGSKLEKSICELNDPCIALKVSVKTAADTIQYFSHLF